MTEPRSMTETLREIPWWLRERIENAKLWTGLRWFRTSDESDRDLFAEEWHPPLSLGWDGREMVLVPERAEAWSSHVQGKVGTSRLHDPESLHQIMLDLDVAAVCQPSTHPNHSHLIINKYVRWADYVALMEAMVKCGILERGYLEASRRRGETFLRLPWIRKGHEGEDQQRALMEWLEQDPNAPWVKGDVAVEDWLDEVPTAPDPF